MSFLPGLFPAGVMANRKRDATIAYVGNVDSTANSANYSFASVNVGAAGAGRKVVVGVHITGTATGLSATYAGSPMTQLGFVDGANASMGIFAIDEAAAATATIVITAAGGTPIACRIWIWNVFNGNPAPHDVRSNIVLNNTAAPTNFWEVNLNCPAGSVVAAVASNVSNIGTPSATWTNATERQDSTLELSTDVATAADATLAGANPALNVRETWTSVSPAGGTILAVCL